MIEIVVPQVGEAVAEVTLARWLKHEGDPVRVGDVLFEVDTDKAVVEVEAFATGTLAQILVPEGSAVMPKQVVALLAPADEQAAAPSPQAPARTVKAPGPAPAAPDDNVSPVARRLALDSGVDLSRVDGSGPSGRVMADDVRRTATQQAGRGEPGAPLARALASPKARRVAKELGVALDGLLGTGVDGMITAQDVQAADQAPPAPSQASPAGVQPLSKLRRSIATRMQASKQTIPHFYLMVEVDMTQADRLRAYCVESLGWERPPTYTDIIVRACALALAAMPSVNVIYTDEGLVRRGSVDIGIAVGVDDGLLVAVLPHTDRLSLQEITRDSPAMVERARDGRLRDADLSQKSMVVSNLGMYGVDTFVAIIDPPAPMILAVGRVAEQIVPIEGQPALRSMSTMTLSVDHRALDGVAGAKFLGRVRESLENPFELLG